MDQARRKGRHVGRSRVTERARVAREWPRIGARIEAGASPRACSAGDFHSAESGDFQCCHWWAPIGSDE